MNRLIQACLAGVLALAVQHAHAQACCTNAGGTTSACSATGFVICGDGTVSGCVCGSGTSQPPTLGQLSVPSTTSLGEVMVGSTSMPFTLKVTNVGALPVAVTSVSSGAPNEFVITSHTCASVTGGGACFVTVVFKPFVAAFRSTYVTLSSNGVGSPNAFLVTGNGRPVGGPPPAAGAPTVDVVEYFHDAWDHYFVTAYATEIEKLDGGKFAGWTRTGLAFKAYPNGLPGTASMCRFFSNAFGERSSHFYTPIASGPESSVHQGRRRALRDGGVRLDARGLREPGRDRLHALRPRAAVRETRDFPSPAHPGRSVRLLDQQGSNYFDCPCGAGAGVDCGAAF